MAGAEGILVLVMLLGLVLLGAGALLFVSRTLGELSLSLDVQLITYGLLILLFGTVAGKLLSRD